MQKKIHFPLFNDILRDLLLGDIGVGVEELTRGEAVSGGLQNPRRRRHVWVLLDSTTQAELLRQPLGTGDILTPHIPPKAICQIPYPMLCSQQPQNWLRPRG